MFVPLSLDKVQCECGVNMNHVPVSGVLLYCIVLYRTVSYCIVLFVILCYCISTTISSDQVYNEVYKFIYKKGRYLQVTSTDTFHLPAQTCCHKENCYCANKEECKHEARDHSEV